VVADKADKAVSRGKGESNSFALPNQNKWKGETKTMDVVLKIETSDEGLGELIRLIAYKVSQIYLVNTGLVSRTAREKRKSRALELEGILRQLEEQQNELD